MSRPNTDTFKAMSKPMQDLIVRVVENACDFVSDMMIEVADDVLKMSVGAVYDQAVDFMCQELDPTGLAAIELPDATKQAIKEVIVATVGFSVNKRFLVGIRG